MEENMPENKGMVENPAEDKPEMPMTQSKKSNTPIIAAAITVVLILVAAVAGYFILNNNSKDLNNSESLEEYIDDAATKVKDFKGVLVVKGYTEDEQTAEISIDLNNDIVYYIDNTTDQAAYYTEEMAYTKIGGEWYSSDIEVAGVSISDFQNITDVEQETDIEDFEYEGKVDCPESKGECHKIHNEAKDSTSYFNTKTNFIVYVEANGESYLYEFNETGELEIPEEVTDEAIDYSALPVNPDASDDTDDDYDYSDLLEEGDADYYQDLLDQYESEL